MKNNQFLLTLGCLGLALATQASIVTFNFQENGLDKLGTSSTFTEGGFSIVASGFDTSGNTAHLFSKFTPGDPSETGLGLIEDSGLDHEIDTTHFVQLDLSSLKSTSSCIISFGSVQRGESAVVYATKTPGSLVGATLVQTLTVDGTVDVTSFVNAGDFIDVRAGSVNVLITSLAATVCDGQVGDFVWNDVNGNGCQDAGEPGIPGVTVDLYAGCGARAVFVTSTTTDANGKYLFTGLCAGDYSVAFHTPAGYTHTLAHVTCNVPGVPTNETDSNCECTGSADCAVCVTLPTGNSQDLTIDCGYIRCVCDPHDVKYNFNGTQIAFQPVGAQNYIWFLSDGVVKNLPLNQVTTLAIINQHITIPVNPPIVVPVPDAVITFDPSATIATTTFDTANNVWRSTFPVSGLAGNLFYAGVAFPVPGPNGLPGGIKNVDWSGEFSTSTQGLNVSWQWHAAVYNKLTTDYNVLAVKPTDDNHKSIYQNSHHAGTPEGTDPASNKLWKTFVVGGASGGGGGNYTGSGSSTISFPPCVCP